MSSKWEARERSTKRVALITSVVFHVILLVAISSSRSGKHTFENLLEQVFGGEPQQEQVLPDTKV